MSDKDEVSACIIIDLQSYEVTEASSLPQDLAENDVYKLEKMVLARIPKGTFIMGSPPDEMGRGTDEEQHTVTLSKDFYLGVFTVTQAQFNIALPGWLRMCLTKGAKQPFENVCWQRLRGGKWPSGRPQGRNFISVLREKTGNRYNFDFPTEAQWEYACRAGTINAYNNDTDCLTEEKEQDANLEPLGWYIPGRDENKDDDFYTHKEVGQKQPNAWGLFDMHGNVRELCLDWYGEYETGPTDPAGPKRGGRRVVRGGSWMSIPCQCRSASRGKDIPDGHDHDVGFRLCLQGDN